jgi:streptomycin 6-kinase
VPAQWRERIRRLPPEGGPSGADWAAALPRLLAGLLDDWGLTTTGAGMTGLTALAVPVTRDGRAHVLKVGWSHPESAGEHLALRRWGGAGAVRLVAADPAKGALLLEALDPRRDLAAAPIDEACDVAGALLARLHVPALPGLRRLSDLLAQQLEDLPAHSGVVPRRMLDQAGSLLRELAAEPGVDGTLLHTDLHYANVLAGEREPWLAIDPKPMAGRPGFELAPLLRNRVAEMGTGSAFRWSVRRRLELLCEAAGIDEDEARAWVVVREVDEAMWAAHHGQPERVTLAVSLIKPVGD